MHFCWENKTIELKLGTTDVHRPAYVIMMIADNLAPSRNQSITIHHADLIVIIIEYNHFTHIIAY